MRTIAALFLIAGLIASPQFPPAQPAHACSCASPELEELVARAEFVVLGTVVQIDQVAQDPRTLPLEYDLTVDADEYLKGVGQDRFHVQDFSLQGSACSAFTPDSVGQQYLLFLSHWEGDLRTSVCAGSGRVTATEYWQERIKEVRQIVSGNQQPGDTPAPAVTPAPQLPPAGSGSGSDPSLPIFAAIAGIIGALGAGLLLGVRRLRAS